MNAERRPIGLMDRTCMAVIAAIGWFALVLQFYLMIIAFSGSRRGPASIDV
jgi:hypothetical protein